MKAEEIKKLYDEFIKSYEAISRDKIWLTLSKKFQTFWYEKIVSDTTTKLETDEIDEIVRILDIKGKGNKKDSNAIAAVMVPQVAWRNLFQELCSNKNLSDLITQIFEEKDLQKKIGLIDQLYEVNKNNRNYLTGRSGNTINAVLAAFDPMKNLSMVSMRDRKMLIDYFEFPVPFNFEEVTSGYKFIESNRIILENFLALGVNGSAMTISAFCYSKPVKTIWREIHTVKRPGKDISVIIPSDYEDNDQEDDFNLDDEPRESIKIQSLLAKIGSEMNFSIWLPKSDRSRVLKNWTPSAGELLESLPLNYNNAVMKTVENIDVLWLKRGSIIRAFEVEHTTSIYSGILRMADLLALLPNINIKLHIVAPISRKEKVFEEIQRPVFSLLESGEMAEVCSYLSYDSVIELSEVKHLIHLSDSVLDDFEEVAE